MMWLGCLQVRDKYWLNQSLLCQLRKLGMIKNQVRRNTWCNKNLILNMGQLILIGRKLFFLFGVGIRFYYGGSLVCSIVSEIWNCIKKMEEIGLRGYLFLWQDSTVGVQVTVGFIWYHITGKRLNIYVLVRIGLCLAGSWDYLAGSDRKFEVNS